MSRRFLAVFHKWHVHSYGFDWISISAEDEVSANGKAAAELINRNRRDFEKSDYVLIEIGPDVPIQPRQLTWKERISGKILPQCVDAAMRAQAGEGVEV